VGRLRRPPGLSVANAGVYTGGDFAAAMAAGVAAGTGLRSEDVADAVLYMLTRPSHVNIRDLVVLRVNQEIWAGNDDAVTGSAAQPPSVTARHPV
jgi:hypothetical protein